MFARRDGVELEELPHSGVSALATLETKEKQQLFDSLTSKITAKRRVVFRLFELEGYDGQEIADILGVPINTVWTRLHYARKDFSTLLARYRTTARDDA